MTLSKLDIELGKIDMKFGKSEFLGDKPKLEFFIRYCHPIAVDKTGDGIAVAMRRFKEDKHGKTGLFLLEMPYPYSLDGLEDARATGLDFAKMLYNLRDAVIEESDTLPTANNFDDNKIYRVDLEHHILYYSSKH